jgi:metal-responsive CopG/Arc/MetJ family transcriptional regulator
MGHRLKEHITITLDPELKKAIDEAARKHDSDRSSLISLILDLVFRPEKFKVEAENQNPVVDIVNSMILANLVKIMQPFMEAVQEAEAKP